mmetsp:Transcript_2200/g.4694  ORF Transcript_2200/g.4694 Transcript_2200/m.4694 type:complete len:83 (+) Transcript_2200:72-320(+)
MDSGLEERLDCPNASTDGIPSIVFDIHDKPQDEVHGDPFNPEYTETQLGSPWRSISVVCLSDYGVVIRLYFHSRFIFDLLDI